MVVGEDTATVGLGTTEGITMVLMEELETLGTGVDVGVSVGVEVVESTAASTQ